MSSSSTTLYSYWRSSASWRVRIVLSYKNIDYNYIGVNLLSKGNLTEEYLSKNPLGQIPTYVDEDVTLTQSLAIIHYLEQKYPEPAMVPKDLYRMAKMWEVCEIINSGIQPVQNSSVLEDIEKLGGNKVEWAQRVIRDGLYSVEKILEATSGTYCIGDEITVADACLVPQIYNARRFEVDLSQFPNINKVVASLASRPDFQRADARALKLRNFKKALSTEPVKPIIKSVIPGPQSISLLNQYQSVSQEFRSVRFFVDYHASAGNYVADADGNLLLDLSGQESSLPIGYNNKRLDEYLKTFAMESNLMHRTSCAIQPSDKWPELIKSTLMPLAPTGLTDVFNSCGCSYGSNENAIKVASIWFYKQRHGEKYSKEQLQTALQGKEPGIPSQSLISLSGSLHTNFTSLHRSAKSYLPQTSFLTAPFPKLKYGSDNALEEAKSLESVKNLFKANPNIFGLIVEPIQHVGNHYASESYYTSLEKIVREHHAALIVDETFVGYGGTGKLWAHQHYGLRPDILVYGGKTQVTGFFMKPEFRPPEGYQVMNTWCGDPARLQIFQGINNVVQTQNLIEKAESVGKYLISNLAKVLESKKQVSNLRGKGLHIAFDFTTKDLAWKFCRDLLTKGVHVNITDDKTIQLSPSLIFDTSHADIFLEAAEASLVS